jgi:acyl-CoA thioesterase I
MAQNTVIMEAMGQILRTRRLTLPPGTVAGLLLSALAVTASAWMSACERSNAGTPVAGALRGTARSSTSPGPPVPTSRPRIVVLGDSLSSGLGLTSDEAFPSLLQQKIDAQGLKFEVVNAGVSGDTTAGGLRRLDWALDGQVQVLIVELGANDGLRGLSVDEMTSNLSQIVERAQQRGVAVLLCGMEAPPNFGAPYGAAFRAAYREVANRYRIKLVPFLLDGVAGLPELNQPDGIHPNARGAQRVAENIWGTLRPLLGEQMSSS